MHSSFFNSFRMLGDFELQRLRSAAPWAQIESFAGRRREQLQGAWLNQNANFYSTTRRVPRLETWDFKLGRMLWPVKFSKARYKLAVATGLKNVNRHVQDGLADLLRWTLEAAWCPVWMGRTAVCHLSFWRMRNRTSERQDEGTRFSPLCCPTAAHKQPHVHV